MVIEKYTPQNLWRAINSPQLFARELNRLYFTRGYTRDYNTEGVDIFEEDWDNLLILDACRHDMLEEGDLPGELYKKTSRGSNTREFLEANFGGKELHDTVYVTANAQLAKYEESVDTELYDTTHVWREEGWHEEFKTVLPETVTQYAKEAHDRNPNKRLIVHYVQPHQPFIGPTGREYFDPSGNSPWREFMESDCEIPLEKTITAFNENLHLALPHVEELIEYLTGKTVVSSDHGQMVGDRSFPIPIREFGHPKQMYTSGLVKIPWLVCKYSERKEITTEPPSQTQERIDESRVNERLRNLGYQE